VGGANTTPNFLAAHFAKRNTKNCGGEKEAAKARAGKNSFPPTQYERKSLLGFLFFR